MKLTGRTVLITGGTSGIGLEFARRLLAMGNTVVVTGRREAALAQVRAKLPGVVALQSDAADPLAVASLRDAVLRQHPALDVLIHCAGIMHKVDLQKVKNLHEVTREIETDLNGTIWTNLAFLDHLRSRPEAALVNVSSGLAFVPLAIAPVYSAAKAGVHAFTKCLRLQMQNTKVKVIELAPPATDTPLIGGEFTEVDQGGLTPMPVATLVERALQGIQRGKTEIRPGMANALKVLARIVPNRAPGLIGGAAVKVMLEQN